MAKPSLSWPQNLNPGERLELAGRKADRLIDLVLALDQMHQTNQLVLYTDALSSQIPRSYAGHAFQQFQHSLYQFELIRLASMWDAGGGDRFSLMSVKMLVDDDAVIAAAVERTRARYAYPYPAHFDVGGAGPEAARDLESWANEDRQRRTDENAIACERDLRQAIHRCNEVFNSAELVSLRELRNDAIAHNLRRKHENDPTSPEPWRYGGETDLLRETIVVANLFSSALNSSSFDWDGMQEKHARNASELWHNCVFDIPHR